MQRRSQMSRSSWQVAYEHLFAADRLAELGSQRDRRERHWRRVIESPPWPSHTIIAEQQWRTLGFASSGRSLEDEALGELHAIYVLPESWGVGVGRALMTETLARLRSSGFEQAILWVFEDNPRARAFYELAGWHADGGVKDEEWLRTLAREIRYRIDLGAS